MKSIKTEYPNRIEYRNEQGLLHRTDGPALEWYDGHKEWWINGESHRTNGPAVEWKNGTKEWWIKGQLYREDGPAIEWNDGTKSWFLKGKKYSEQDWLHEITNIKLKRILDL